MLRETNMTKQHACYCQNMEYERQISCLIFTEGNGWTLLDEVGLVGAFSIVHCHSSLSQVAVDSFVLTNIINIQK